MTHVPASNRSYPSTALSELESLAPADLMSRPEVELNDANVAQFFEGARVIITGAGGSIGSELTRRIAAMHPDALMLLDQSEYALYQLEENLSRWAAAPFTSCLVCNVRDSTRLQQLITEWSADIILHAAALKHVAFAQTCPSEAVLTNVYGTRNMIDLADVCGVKHFVLLSSDKAVSPCGVMGMTKRLSECYTQSLDASTAGRTRFLCVRLGNVLDVSGTVVPRFASQLASGGPLTVTHPQVSRYFMTVTEAVGLVLHALPCSERSGDSSQIFLLDVGEPVRIFDLATKMIELAGLKPGRDVQIEFTGLGAGESLTERLMYPFEAANATATPGVIAARSTPLSRDSLEGLFRRLLDAAHQHDQRLVEHYLEEATRLYLCSAPES